MFKMRALFKYTLVILALFSQGSVFAIETDPTTSTSEMTQLKGFGLDKRVKVLGALLLIFAPIGIFAYNKNKQGSLGKESRINILEKKALDQNSSILLVEIHGTTLLLSKTSTGISLIKEVSNLAENQTTKEPDFPTLKNVSLVSNQS